MNITNIIKVHIVGSLEVGRFIRFIDKYNIIPEIDSKTYGSEFIGYFNKSHEESIIKFHSDFLKNADWNFKIGESVIIDGFSKYNNLQGTVLDYKYDSSPEKPYYIKLSNGKTDYFKQVDLIRYES